MVPLVLTVALAAAGPALGPAQAVLTSDGAVCLATGYCTAAPAPRGERAPSGLMYLALGLVGAGVTVLRSEGRERSAQR